MHGPLLDTMQPQDPSQSHHSLEQGMTDEDEEAAGMYSGVCHRTKVSHAGEVGR